MQAPKFIRSINSPPQFRGQIYSKIGIEQVTLGITCIPIVTKSTYLLLGLVERETSGQVQRVDNNTLIVGYRDTIGEGMDRR